MEPAISVIIPVYKCEKYLSQCIESVLNQTFKDFELILVNDGSPDSSPQICDEYAQKDNRIQVIHKENGGVSSARNAGIRVAKGEYITFIDSDDYIDGEMFEKLYEQIKAQNGDLIISSLRYVFEETKEKKEYPLHNVKFHINEIDAFYKEIDSNFGFSAVYAKFYKKEIICNNLIFYAEEFSILEDGSFVLQYLKHCSNCILSEGVFYNYRQTREMSLMKAFNSNAIDALAYYDDKAKWLQELLSEENKEQYDYKLYYLLTNFLYQIFTARILKKKDRKKLVKVYMNHSITHQIVNNIDNLKMPIKRRIIAKIIKRNWSGLFFILAYFRITKRRV